MKSMVVCVSLSKYGHTQIRSSTIFFPQIYLCSWSLVFDLNLWLKCIGRLFIHYRRRRRHWLYWTRQKLAYIQTVSAVDGIIHSTKWRKKQTVHDINSNIFIHKKTKYMLQFCERRKFVRISHLKSRMEIPRGKMEMAHLVFTSHTNR